MNKKFLQDLLCWPKEYLTRTELDSRLDILQELARLYPSGRVRKFLNL